MAMTYDETKVDELLSLLVTLQIIPSDSLKIARAKAAIIALIESLAEVP